MELMGSRCMQTTVASMKRRVVVEAQLVDSDGLCGRELLFQPKHEVLDDLEVWTQEYLII